MMTKKQLIKRANQARKDNDMELAGMLEELNRLKYNYVPQLVAKFKDSTFPHHMKVAGKFKLFLIRVIDKIL